MNKYNIEYSEFYLDKKPIFLFVNHKTAVLCWAKIKEKKNEKFDIITFDSHRDFFDGFLIGECDPMRDSHFRSKYLENQRLKHFLECKEFLLWNPLNKVENKNIICKNKKFLTYQNDNFIDVAFMKDIISDVYWHHIEAPFGGESGKCDDINSKDHFFKKSNLRKVMHPKRIFVLDIDLDYFVRGPGMENVLFTKNKMEKYIKLQKKLFDNQNCLGMTIALEHPFCGGKDNCLEIIKQLEKVFGLNILDISKRLIEESEAN